MPQSHSACFIFAVLGWSDVFYSAPHTICPASVLMSYMKKSFGTCSLVEGASPPIGNGHGGIRILDDRNRIAAIQGCDGHRRRQGQHTVRPRSLHVWSQDGGEGGVNGGCRDTPNAESSTWLVKMDRKRPQLSVVHVNNKPQGPSPRSWLAAQTNRVPSVVQASQAMLFVFLLSSSTPCDRNAASPPEARKSARARPRGSLP